MGAALPPQNARWKKKRQKPRVDLLNSRIRWLEKPLLFGDLVRCFVFGKEVLLGEQEVLLAFDFYLGPAKFLVDHTIPYGHFIGGIFSHRFRHNRKVVGR